MHMDDIWAEPVQVFEKWSMGRGAPQSRGRQGGDPPGWSPLADGVAVTLEELYVMSAIEEPGRLLVDDTVLSARRVGTVAVVDDQDSHGVRRPGAGITSDAATATSSR